GREIVKPSWGTGLLSRKRERICWGTEGSNPSPSSRKSSANLIFGDESHRCPFGPVAEPAGSRFLHLQPFAPDSPKAEIGCKADSPDHEDTGEDVVCAKRLLSLQNHVSHTNSCPDHLGGNDHDQRHTSGQAHSC